MLKPAEDTYRDIWQHCYDVGQLLMTRGHEVNGIHTGYSDRGDWSYYIVVDHIARVYDYECRSIKDDAETIKDVVVRIETRVQQERAKLSWNYRIVRKGSYLGIHEAYYDGGDEKPHSITENACRPGGETIEELERDLEYMREALKLPILEFGAIGRVE